MNQPLPSKPEPTQPEPTQASNGDLAAVYMPLRTVQRLGNRTMRDGMYIGLIFALLGHTFAIGGPQYTLWQMRLAVGVMNRELNEYFERTLDVTMDEEKPEADETPPPAPEPEQVEPEQVEPEPVVPPEEEEKKDPYEDEGDEADTAEAQDVLTANEDAVNLTGDNTFVDKDGSTSTGSGKTSVKGKRNEHVKDKHVRPGGKGKGKRKGPGTQRKAPEPKENCARGATVKGGTNWSVPWPSQADLYQVDRASVTLSIVVGPDGRAKSVTVKSDPGYGFGSAARRYASGRQYVPAMSAECEAISQTIQVRVTFKR